MGLRRVVLAATVALAAALVALGVVVATGHGHTRLHARASATATTTLPPRATSGARTTLPGAPGAHTTTTGATPVSSQTATSLPPPPAGFEPASVSFVSPSLGYALGVAPCAAPPCTVLLRTEDGGETWHELRAPAVPVGTGPSDPGTVSRVRFASALEGFVFDPAVEVSFDGGETWRPASFPGEPAGAAVVGVGSAGGAVFVLVLPPQPSLTAPPTPGGTARLYRALVGSPAFSPVPGATVADAEAGELSVAGSSAFVVVTRSTGSTVALSAGPSGPASPIALPCGAPSGEPVLAPSSSSDLFAVCGGGAALGQQPKTAYRSLDGGRSFTLAGPVGPDGDLEAAASDGPDTVIVAAASAGSFLYLSEDGGRSFREVYAAATGGAPLSDLAFVSSTEVVAVEGLPEVASGSVLLVSRDGGSSFAAAPFRG